MSDSIETHISRRYILQQKLGEGGMGAVYQAADRLTGETVALKQVTVPSGKLQFASQASMGKSGDFRLALAQEFKTLATLRHPHIVSVLDYGFDQQRQPFLTMELLEDAPNLIEVGRDLPRPQQIALLVQLLQALAYLHRRGIIHRDLKPDNVLVTERQVRALDFGLAVARKHSTEQNRDIYGTPAYMAPEVFEGQPASEASDLYAVGLMAYELFAGRHPFDTTNFASLVQDLLTATPDVDVLGLDEGLANILKGLLAKDPAERHNDAGQIINLFAEATSQPDLMMETRAIRESYLQAAEFVGREVEFGQLVNELAATQSGQGSACLIGGESGVGKSRLVDELRTLALVEGAEVIRGQAVSEGGVPYQAWQEILRWLALQADLSAVEGSILKPFVPDIGHFHEKEFPDPLPIEPQQVPVRLFNAIRDILQRQTVPVLLILEDLQWARSESIEMIKRVNGLTPELPLMLVGNYRDDERPKLPETLSDMKHMKLERFKEDEIAELSASMLGEAGRRPDVVALLQRETEGNTFFLVEVVRALAEQAGRLEHVSVMSLPERVFTGGVQEIVQRRLQQVPPGAQNLLQRAAIAGRLLDLRVLQEYIDQGVTPLVRDLDHWLTICADAAVLEPIDDDWQFTHDKLREHLLAQIQDEQRTALYRSVAEAIERVHPASLEHVEVLAYLWRVADSPEKELHYCQIAGQQALKNSATEEAVRYLQRALALLLAQPESLERDQRELELQLALGPALQQTQGSWAADVERTYARARELSQAAKDSPELFKALWGLWVFYLFRAEWPVVVELGEQLGAMAERSGNTDLLLQAHHTKWTHLLAIGDLVGAQASAEQGIQIYDRQQHHAQTFIYGGHDPGVCCRMNSALLLWLLGYPEQASQRVQETASLAEELKHPYSQMAALLFALFVYQLRDEVITLRDVAETLISLPSTHPLAAFGVFYRGWAQFKLGKQEEGLQQLQQSLDGTQAMNVLRTVTLSTMMDVYAELEMPDEGLKAASEALELVEAGERIYEAEIHRLHGELLLMKDAATAEIETQFNKAIEVAQRQQARSWELRATTSLARLWQSQGKVLEARDKLSTIYNWFTEGFGTVDLKEAKALLEELS